MTKENILEIINKEGLFQYNVFHDHQQKANEVIIRHENDQYIVFRTDENNVVIGKEQSYSNENDAVNNFIKQLHEIKKLYLSTIVGDSYIIYYQDKYRNKPLNKLFISWKWPPLFIGYGWLIYRKLYLEAAIIFCFLILVGFILTIFNLNNEYLRDIYGCIKIILALIGNSLYYLKINRIIKKMNDTGSKNHIEYLKKHGGTNIIAAIGFELLLTGIAILTLFI